MRLYIKLGKRIGLTIRQLGYPTKNALKTWYREYEQRQDIPAGYTRPAKFSQAEKERAVQHFLGHGQSIAATIKALGYPCRYCCPHGCKSSIRSARASSVDRRSSRPMPSSLL